MIGVPASSVVGALFLTVGSTTSSASPSTASATAAAQDRTVLCTTSVFNGYRRISAAFQPVIRSSTPPTVSGAFAGVGSGGTLNSLNLAFVSAGPGVPKGREVGIDTRRCKRVRTSVALSPRGLPTPAVPYRKAVNCSLQTVLIRVRAVIEGDRAIRGELAARTSNGRTPIAYARINANGSGAFYYSSSCE